MNSGYADNGRTIYKSRITIHPALVRIRIATRAICINTTSMWVPDVTGQSACLGALVLSLMLGVQYYPSMVHALKSTIDSPLSKKSNSGRDNRASHS